MKSLNQMWNATYFDKVHIASRMRHYSKYQFVSEELVSKACNPYPYKDHLVIREVHMFKGVEYCETLHTFLLTGAFRLLPAGKFVGKDDIKTMLGPFILGREFEPTGSSSHKLRLIIQDLISQTVDDENRAKSARVFLIARVIQSVKFWYPDIRMGVSDSTLSAGGIWHASDGQLCMVGCIGSQDASSDRCNSTICLYFPQTFSIKERTGVFGSMTSIYESNSQPALILEQDENTWSRISWRNLRLSYNYTKIAEAKEFKKRNRAPEFLTNLRKSIFSYPSSKGDGIADFSLFADILSVSARVVPPALPNGLTNKIKIDIFILSIGPFVGRCEPSSYQKELEVQKPFHPRLETVEISGYLSITSELFGASEISFEGLYDPKVGQMYLIGCKDLRGLQTSAFNTTNQEDFDCLIEMKIEFSPKNARWLQNTKIKISINSKRNKEDPLYLSPVSTNAFPLTLIYNMDFLVFRKSFEVMLRILMLITTVFCLKSQLQCAENNGHPTAYISEVMLSIQSLSYSLPFIGNDEPFFRWKELTPSNNLGNELEKQEVFAVLDLFLKALLILALLHNFKLLRQVWESRQKQNNQAMILSTRIPSDKMVLVSAFLIHVVGFCLLLAICKAFSSTIFEFIVYIYIMIVQDFFLLPQIIGNILWGIPGKPLTKSYYIGFTMIRLLIQAYDYARDPIAYADFPDLLLQYQGMESCVKLRNILIGIVIFILAVIVHFQQNYAFQRSRLIKMLQDEEVGASKFDAPYQRLLSE